ncbi:MAG: peptidylprolyl isomerase [Marmoricola sp.]
MLTPRLAGLVLAPLLALTAACGSSGPAPAASGSTASSTPPTSAPAAPRSSAAPASSTPTPSAPATAPSTAAGSPPAGPCAYPSAGQAAKPAEAPPATPVTRTPTGATVTTNRGTIGLTLEADEAPCTVNSFLSLAKQGYFDGTPCHRLTTAGIYVLQCGDPSGTGAGGPGYSFADELKKNDPRIQPCPKIDTPTGPQAICTYPAGTVAMANSGPDSNGSQFFLVYRDSHLPNAYTVFGRMDAQGLKTVQQIAADGLAPGTQGDGAPKRPVTITSVTAS